MGYRICQSYISCRNLQKLLQRTLWWFPCLRQRLSQEEVLHNYNIKISLRIININKNHGGTLKVDSIENLNGNGYVTTAGNTSIDASGATTSIKLPRGTTAQRPSNAPAESVRFNTDNNRLEYYDEAVWRNGDGSSSQTTMTRDGDPYWKNVVLLIKMVLKEIGVVTIMGNI